MPSSPRTTPQASVPRPLSDAPMVERTKAGLLALLDAVDGEGWNGPAATALLSYIRTDLIRPLAIDVGLRGTAASQAEATAWEAAVKPRRRSRSTCGGRPLAGSRSPRRGSTRRC